MKSELWSHFFFKKKNYTCFLPLPVYVKVVEPCGIMIFLLCDLYKSRGVTSSICGQTRLGCLYMTVCENILGTSIILQVLRDSTNLSGKGLGAWVDHIEDSYGY